MSPRRDGCTVRDEVATTETGGINPMKIWHYPENDVVYVRLGDEPVADTRFIGDTVALDYASTGTLVGVEFLAASQGVHVPDDLPHSTSIGRLLEEHGYQVLITV
jgi:uncharacterized protein YuzE